MLPASLFVDSHQVICDNGPYKLYRIIEHDDTDDYEYFLDPPIYGKEKSVGLRWESRAHGAGGNDLRPYADKLQQTDYLIQGVVGSIT